MKKVKKTSVILLLLIFCLTLLFPFAFAKESQGERLGNFNNPKGRVFSCAKRGDVRFFPENAAEGIRFCAEQGIDIVQIDLKKTKDDKYVLMKDDTLERMTVKRDGSSSKVKVKDETLENIKNNYLLKDGHGGPLAKPTKLTISSFEEAIDIARDRCILLVDVDFNEALNINNIVKNKAATDFVILRCAKTPQEVDKFTKTAGVPACPISSVYNDNTKGSAKKFVEGSIESGATCITLNSSKKGASSFKKKTIKALKDKGRAIVDMSDPKLCGGLEDNEKGWENVIRSGFGIIETDYSVELAEYLRQTTNKRANLMSLIQNAESLNINAYSNDSAKQFSEALKNAKEDTSNLKTPLSEIKQSSYDLQEAIYNLQIRTKADEKKERNKVIIIISFIAIVVVVLGGYFLFRKRPPKKNKKVKQR